MAVRTLPRAGSGAPSAAVAGLPRSALTPAAVVLSVAFPILFLHVDYQPGLTVHVGSSAFHAVLSDFVVLGVGIAGLVAGLRWGFAPLRAGKAVWISGGLFVLMIGAATLYPRLYEDHYRTSVHAVTAIKFAEYGVLALALPLLVRGVDDLVLPFVTVVAWSAAATVVGITQFFGASYLEAWAAGRRQPSFLGHHDFAALSGATLSLALAAVAFGSVWRPPRALVVVAGLAGGLGLVVSGSTAGGIGLLAAAAAAALIAHKRFGLTLQRAGVLAAIAGVVFLGIIVLRGRDFDQFLRFVGVEPEQQTTRAGVQTYAQRTILSYIGLKIFLDHPVAGVGWEGSGDQEAYGPQLAAARAKFPDANPLAFPSPAHAYGVQNGWVQALADLGLIGFACFAALYLSGLLVGSGAALRAPPDFAVVGLVAVLWLLVTMGVWTAVGLVAGLPQDALLWTALGLAVVASAGARRAAG